MSGALDARTAVVELAKAAVSGMGVTVEDGFWDESEAESLTVGDIEWTSSDWDGIGNRNRQDNFNIEIIIFAGKNDQTNLEAITRAYEIYSAFEKMHRSDPSLGGAVHLSFTKPEKVGAQPAIDGGSTSLLIGVVACTGKRY